MQINRLPTSDVEKPYLYAAYDVDKKRVKFCIDDPDMWDREDMKDGTNWFQIWRVEDSVCVRSTQWYTSEGEFKMTCNLVTPAHAVFMADRAAYYANDFIDGGFSVEDIKL